MGKYIKILFYIAAAFVGCFFFAKILKNTLKNTSKNSLVYRNSGILDTEKTKKKSKIICAGEYIK